MSICQFRVFKRLAV
jgi:hypothetical protein